MFDCNDESNTDKNASALMSVWNWKISKFEIALYRPKICIQFLDKSSAYWRLRSRHISPCHFDPRGAALC